jgi:hypothetical protein
MPSDQYWPLDGRKSGLLDWTWQLHDPEVEDIKILRNVGKYSYKNLSLWHFVDSKDSLKSESGLDGEIPATNTLNHGMVL